MAGNRWKERLFQQWSYAGSQRQGVTLIPDLGATEQWNAKSALLSGICNKVTVSDILERTATEEQRSQGLDIADFFLFSPSKRQILQLMIQRNPALQLLINGLDLALVE